MTVAGLAAAAGVTEQRLTKITTNAAPIDAATDAALTRYFRISSGFFLRLQADYAAEEVKRRRDASRWIVPSEWTP